MTTPNDDSAPRVWLVTGASSGFGRAIAEAALRAGDRVIATARRPETVADLLAAYPDRAAALPLDVTDIGGIEVTVAEAVRLFGGVDVLVNNAGRGHVGAVEETTDEELRSLMDLHFFGPAALTRAVLPRMRERRSGAIVQITSMGGRMSFPAVGCYSASKFALEGLSEALAQEVAPHGIKVLIVEPGSFRTGLAGGRQTQSAALDAYAETVGLFRTDFPASDGMQPGDPAKAAAAILTALAAGHTPLRLPLGNDAWSAISDAAERAQEELAAWRDITRGTDFDPAS